jgi:hypothetical protein
VKKASRLFGERGLPGLEDYFRFADNPTEILPVITERPAPAHLALERPKASSIGLREPWSIIPASREYVDESWSNQERPCAKSVARYERSSNDLEEDACYSEKTKLKRRTP